MEALNNTYQRALVSMHKMPRIWLEYLVSLFTLTRQGTCHLQVKAETLRLKITQVYIFMGGVYMLENYCWMQEFLVSQGIVTKTRRAFDSALCALPITQHERIWQIYLVSMSLQHAAPCHFCADRSTHSCPCELLFQADDVVIWHEEEQASTHIEIVGINQHHLCAL